jgi:hypothetical protein
VEARPDFEAVKLGATSKKKLAEIFGGKLALDQSSGVQVVEVLESSLTSL